jgi:hypothetical protein
LNAQSRSKAAPHRAPQNLTLTLEEVTSRYGLEGGDREVRFTAALDGRLRLVSALVSSWGQVRFPHELTESGESLGVPQLDAIVVARARELAGASAEVEMLGGRG